MLIYKPVFTKMTTALPTAAIVLFGITSAVMEDDLILNLPGLNYDVDFKQYSGYLKASDTRYLHYWFVESQNDPLNDPVVLWLSGGPGCSSIVALLRENGPFFANEDGTGLYENPYSWNAVANMLYLESPAGVGYSYSTDGNINTGDDDTANQNCNALIDFFTEFSEFVNNEFYIVGESYGGIFAPTLAQLIVDGQFDFNLKGIAVGNGLSDYNLNKNSLMYFSYHYGLIGDSQWKNMTKHCCSNNFGNYDKCNFANPPNDLCSAEVAKVEYLIHFNGINAYSLYSECIYSSDSYRLYKTFKDPQVPIQQCIIENPGIVTYMNDPDVRVALNIQESLGPWNDCANLPYEKEYMTMYEQYQYLLDKNCRFLLYNGDNDLVCNFLGGQWFVASLNKTVVKRHQPWYYDGQVAGFVEQFDGITFTTILGAGHMAAGDKPGASQKMFINFINIQSF